MGIHGAPKFTEHVHHVIRRQTFGKSAKVMELRIVSWTDLETGKETDRHIQKVEKRIDLGGEHVIKVKGLSPVDWTSLLAEKDKITDLLLPAMKKTETPKDYHDHD